jgi:hypothetical protein
MSDEHSKDIHTRLEGMEKTLVGIHKALLGNGRPGLIQDVAQIQIKVENSESDIAKIEASRENDHRFVMAGIATAIFSLFGAFFGLIKGD